MSNLMLQFIVLSESSSDIRSTDVFLLAFAFNNSDFRVNQLSGWYLIFPRPGRTFLQWAVTSVEAWFRREFMSGWIYHSRWIFKRGLQLASAIPCTAGSIAVPIAAKIYPVGNQTFFHSFK